MANLSITSSRLEKLDDHLGDVEVMCIQREQAEPILGGAGSDPHVVRWDGGALPPKVVPDNRIVDRRLIVHMQNAYSGFGGEFTQPRLVLSPAPAFQEGSQEL